MEGGGLRPAGGPQADGAIGCPVGGVRVATSMRSGGELGGAGRPDGRPPWTAPGVSWADADEAGAALMVASNTGARIVVLARGRVIREVASGPLAPIGIRPGGGCVWTRSYDGAIDVLDLETGVSLERFDAAAGGAAAVVAATPAARVVAGATGPSVSMRLRPFQPARRIEAGREAGAQGLAVSADGRLAAAAGERERVQPWDVPSATRLRAVDQPGGIGANVVFTPDGSTLPSAGESRDVGVLRLDLPARLAAARARLVGGGGGRGAAFAEPGWWERALLEPDVDPEMAASARLAQEGARWPRLRLPGAGGTVRPCNPTLPSRSPRSRRWRSS